MKTGKIISGLLALLGFAGCDDFGEQRDMYGTPHAEFEFKGAVTNEYNAPLRDVKIVVKSGWNDNEIAVGITDSRGEYDIEFGDMGGSGITFSVVAEDIDGEANGGKFATETETIEIEKEDYVGGDGWYIGKMAKTVDFVLEEAIVVEE
ncbi:MAG: radical SAM-associated putative lipoprotein [Alistipes sp.]|jgi:putative lipoprotein (rSAM/lipoprotein system)|nr:radical SAM-associated putative lipoprotein [Alistipes sp.]